MKISNQNILVVAERAPKYEGGSGDQKILYTLFSQMSNIHFCIINAGNEKTFSLDNWIYYFDIPENNGVPQKKWRYAEFVESFSMKQDRFLRSEKYISHIIGKVQEIITEKNIQVLVFVQDGILMWSWYRYFSDKVKCVLRIHDSHYHYFLSDLITRKQLAYKISLIASAIVQQKYERKHIRQWDQIQFLSQKEFQYYQNEYSDIREKFVYIPPSIVMHRNEYLLNHEKNIDILYVGTMKWKPNTDAVKWFLYEVIPLLKLELPNIKIKIIGKNAEEKIKYQDKNVEIRGFVDSLDEEYRSAKLSINPSISGGGIKVKLMEAAAFGLPIISTSYGLSGFMEDIQYGLMVKDTPKDFADAIVRLLENEGLREEYSHRIYEYAQKNFDIQKNQEIWKAQIEKLYE